MPSPTLDTQSQSSWQRWTMHRWLGCPAQMKGAGLSSFSRKPLMPSVSSASSWLLCVGWVGVSFPAWVLKGKDHTLLILWNWASWFQSIYSRLSQDLLREMPAWKSQLDLGSRLVLTMTLLGLSRDLGTGKCQNQALWHLKYSNTSKQERSWNVPCFST